MPSHHSPQRPAQHDAMLVRVRKILAKAEDPAATPEEAETYTAKAARLIAAYGIDEAMLAADAPGRDLVGDRVIDLAAPYARDKAHLLCDVAGRLRCRAVLRTQPTHQGRTEHSVHLFGHHSDLERTDLLFTSLLLQSTAQLHRVRVPPRESKAAFRRSWLAGFRMSVVRRLADAEATAEAAASGRLTEDGQSTTLVLAGRELEVEQALRDAYPSARTARARQLSGSGMRDGYLAGERADLGGRRLPARRAELDAGG